MRPWVTEGYAPKSSKVLDPKGLEERLMEYLRFCTQVAPARMLATSSTTL